MKINEELKELATQMGLAVQLHMCEHPETGEYIDLEDLPEALENTKVKCFVCGGDGKETCTNPDHGFYGMVSFHYDACNGGRGCPVCGWDENHKIKNGGLCDCCDGLGVLTYKEAFKRADEYSFDDEFKII